MTDAKTTARAWVRDHLGDLPTGARRSSSTASPPGASTARRRSMSICCAGRASRSRPAAAACRRPSAPTWENGKGPTIARLCRVRRRARQLPGGRCREAPARRPLALCRRPYRSAFGPRHRSARRHPRGEGRDGEARHQGPPQILRRAGREVPRLQAHPCRARLLRRPRRDDLASTRCSPCPTRTRSAGTRIAARAMAPSTPSPATARRPGSARPAARSCRAITRARACRAPAMPSCRCTCWARRSRSTCSRSGTSWSVNEAILNMGQATADNLPAGMSQIMYMARVPTLEMAERVITGLDHFAESAARIAHCSWRRDWVCKSRPGLANHAIARTTYRNLETVGAPKWQGEAVRLAQEIQKNLGLAPMDEPYAPDHRGAHCARRRPSGASAPSCRRGRCTTPPTTTPSTAGTRRPCG